jgi:hypothetical protein
LLAELRDGSILFCFGGEADARSSSSAAADAATAAGVSDKEAEEAATAGQKVSEGDASAQQAAHVTAAAEVFSPDDDPHTEEADAGGSGSQSIDKAQLHDLKVCLSENKMLPWSAQQEDMLRKTCCVVLVSLLFLIADEQQWCADYQGPNFAVLFVASSSAEGLCIAGPLAGGGIKGAGSGKRSAWLLDVEKEGAGKFLGGGLARGLSDMKDAACCPEQHTH